MKMTAKIAAGLLIVLSLCVLNCKKSDFGKPAILVTGTEVNPIVKFAVENTPAQFLVTATSTYKAEENINVGSDLDLFPVPHFRALVPGQRPAHHLR